MPRDEGAVLLDIAHCCRRIAELIEGKLVAEFAADETLREAVQYRLIVAGEAVKRLSPEFRESHSGFSWTGVAGLRDVLVHAYERVDHRELWNIATTSVPGLLAYIEPLLPEESD